MSGVRSRAWIYKKVGGGGSSERKKIQRKGRWGSRMHEYTVSITMYCTIMC